MEWANPRALGELGVITLGLPEKSSHSVCPQQPFCNNSPGTASAPVVWLGALACRTEQFANSVPPIICPFPRGNQGPKHKAALLAFLTAIQLLSFQSDFMLTSREQPATPQSRCTGQRRPYRHRSRALPLSAPGTCSPARVLPICFLLTFHKEGGRQTGPRDQTQTPGKGNPLFQTSQRSFFFLSKVCPTHSSYRPFSLCFSEVSALIFIISFSLLLWGLFVFF